MKKKKTFGSVMKEFVRKLLVALKRRPYYIPMIVLGLAFLVYSFHLTSISDTTAKIQGSGMGLCGFAANLLSILSLVCFGNAFRYRKPVNKPMAVLMYVLNAIIIFADVKYLQGIENALTRADSPIEITDSTWYIIEAQYYLKEHIIIIVIGLVLTLLLPVYSKWIRKIKTSVKVEDNGKLGAIEISE